MVRPLDVDMGLHAFGHLDAQEGEACSDSASDDFGECEAEGTQLFILLLEDRELVVELIVFLHEVVDVVCDDSWAIGASCFLYDVRIFGDLSSCSLVDMVSPAKVAGRAIPSSSALRRRLRIRA